MIRRAILTFFFSNNPAPTETYTLSLHDALPIYAEQPADQADDDRLDEELEQDVLAARADREPQAEDRKSTRLNSSHSQISYAVFCLKKKKECDQSRQRRCVR